MLLNQVKNLPASRMQILRPKHMNLATLDFLVVILSSLFIFFFLRSSLLVIFLPIIG